MNSLTKLIIDNTARIESNRSLHDWRDHKTPASKLQRIADLIEVCNDLVEKSQALGALVVDVELHVELVEVGDRRKDDAYAAVALVVQVLRNNAIYQFEPGFNALLRLSDSGYKNFFNSAYFTKSKKLFWTC